MAEAALAAPFGLTGVRRVLAIATAAFALTGCFVVLGFPYERLLPRIEQAVSSATGTPVRIGRVAIGAAWLGPQLRAWDVDATLPSGGRLVFKRIRVHPAWSLSWLRGRPALVVALRSPSGELDGTLTLGAEPAFEGTLQQVKLGDLPQGALSGISLDGVADAEIDLTIAETGAVGRVSLAAKQGSLTLPLLPIGVPFDSLVGKVALGGDKLAEIEALDLVGPLVSIAASGAVGASPVALAAPLSLRTRLEVRDPTVRTLLLGQGVALDANGQAEIEIGGTLGEPQPQSQPPAARGRGRSG